MALTNLLFVTVGMSLALPTWLRLRATLADGLHEYHRGRRCKVSRVEQPRGYWARLLLMVSTCAAGIVLLCEATSLLHL